MASYTPEPPRNSPSPYMMQTQRQQANGGIISTSGPDYTTTSSSSHHATYEMSRTYTETVTDVPTARRSYGSEDNYRSLSPIAPVGVEEAPCACSPAKINDLDYLLQDLSTSIVTERTSTHEVHMPRTNGYISPILRSDKREESPCVDTSSAGQVSQLVGNLEQNMRHTSDIPKWKTGKEIKPITTETFVEEKQAVLEVKPQPIISTPLKAVRTSPKPVRRDHELENLVDSIPEAPKSSLRYQVEPIAKGTCCICKKPIHGQLVTALGKCWHLECFTCVHCGIELGKENFFEKNGSPYCENDFHMLFSPKCAYCSEPIVDKCVSALGKTWHPEHFFCCICGRTFGDEGYHEMDGKAYCRDDYFDLFAPKCAGCNGPITENYISALDAQWHPDCFVCYECRCPFVGGSFFDFEGKPFCETHYHLKRGSLCAACHKPIMGRCITAMFRKFHPEHFVCSFCLQQLNKGTFKEHNDKPYCAGCFDKLFS